MVSYVEEDGAGHNEGARGARAGGMLIFAAGRTTLATIPQQILHPS